jgi:Na+-driven multidrug efflux pump
MPATMLYGFVAAVLRASGDSVRPMVYMLVSGVVNVGLNVLFVGAFGLSVAGVAIATTLSNLLSLILGLAALIRSRGPCRIVKAHLRFRFSEFTAMLRIAVPASLGGLCFFVSNIFISATVNAMSTDAMTANAISGQFDGVIYTVGAAIAVATMNMVGQSLGAQNPKRIKKSLVVGALYGTVASISLGVLFVCFSEPMLYILTDSANVVAIAKDRMTLLCLTYFITTVMEVFSFSLNALHRQTAVMAVCGICGFGIRSAWTFFVYPLAPSLSMLYTSFAVSAGVAIVCYLFIVRGTLRRLKEAFAKEEAPVAVKL